MERIDGVGAGRRPPGRKTSREVVMLLRRIEAERGERLDRSGPVLSTGAPEVLSTGAPEELSTGAPEVLSTGAVGGRPRAARSATASTVTMVGEDEGDAAAAVAADGRTTRAEMASWTALTVAAVVASTRA